MAPDRPPCAMFRRTVKICAGWGLSEQQENVNRIAYLNVANCKRTQAIDMKEALS